MKNKVHFGLDIDYDLKTDDKTITLLPKACDFLRAIKAKKITVRNYKTKGGKFIIRRKEKNNKSSINHYQYLAFKGKVGKKEYKFEICANKLENYFDVDVKKLYIQPHY